MKRCGPGLYRDTSGAEPGLDLWMHPVDPVSPYEHWVSFHVAGTTGEVDLPHELKVRLVCHYLLTQLPDGGLPEALETLTQMREFYSLPPRIVSPRLLPPAISAVYGQPYTREPFQIEE